MPSINAATMITFSRILFSLAFALVFTEGYESATMYQSSVALWVSVVIAVIMEISDALDGYLARLRREVTEMGKLFDPIADTICHCVIFLAFLMTEIIPLWLYLVFFYREMLIIMLRMACLQGNIVVAARKLGKIKTTSQAIAVFCILALCLGMSYGLPFIPEELWGYHPGFWILIIPAFFSILSAFDYLKVNWATIRTALTTKNK